MRHLARLAENALHSSLPFTHPPLLTKTSSFSFAKHSKKRVVEQLFQSQKLPSERHKQKEIKAEVEGEMQLQKQQEKQLHRLMSAHQLAPPKGKSRKVKFQKTIPRQGHSVGMQPPQLEVTRGFLSQQDLIQQATHFIEESTQIMPKRRVGHVVVFSEQHHLTVQSICQMWISLYAKSEQLSNRSIAHSAKMSELAQEMNQTRQISEMFGMELPELNEEASQLDAELTQQEYMEEDYAVLQLQRKIQQAQKICRHAQYF